MSAAVIVAARRTAVAPRDGPFRAVEVADLAAPVIRALLDDAGLPAGAIDEVILGNALYGGGNPARLALLAAGLPQETPALTLDSQCCAGLDAILLAAGRVAGRESEIVVAGGVESFSRAPLRLRRPLDPAAPPEPYDRPPFAPWPERDPDMIPAAAALAAAERLGRPAQEAFAVESHARALRRPAGADEIVPVAGLGQDAFARPLTGRLCARLPVLAGDAAHGVTAATVAVEADAAAAVLVVSERAAARLAARGRPMRVVAGSRRGGDPTCPGLAPVAAANALLARAGVAPKTLAAAEVMEAFAAQAMACIAGIGLDPARVNRGGGALARGHPIGASGAVLAVRLWHELQGASEGAHGLAAIAAAGGLGSALLLAAAERGADAPAGEWSR